MEFLWEGGILKGGEDETAQLLLSMFGEVRMLNDCCRERAMEHWGGEMEWSILEMYRDS